MRRTLVLCGLLVLLAATAAGQTPDEDDGDPRPGLITADNALYGLDIAVDTALVTIGVKKASEAVHERASEAVVAAEAGDMAAADRAVQETNRIAHLAHGINGDGLEQAEQLLLEVREQAPEGSHTGIDQAINEVVQAQHRFPTDVTDREIPARPQPDAAGPAPGGDR